MKIRREAWKRATDRISTHMTASQIMVAGFAILIFAGGLLLSMPVLQRGWKMAEFFGCAVYGMFGGLCDRSCDNYSSGAVHTGRKADPASSDSAWRPRHHSMHDGRLSYSEETDHDPQPGHDPGQL